MERFAGLTREELARLAARKDKAAQELADMILETARKRGDSFALTVMARVSDDNKGDKKLLQAIHDHIVRANKRRLAQQFRRVVKDDGTTLTSPQPMRPRQAAVPPMEQAALDMEQYLKDMGFRSVDSDFSKEQPVISFKTPNGKVRGTLQIISLYPYATRLIWFEGSVRDHEHFRDLDTVLGFLQEHFAEHLKKRRPRRRKKQAGREEQHRKQLITKLFNRMSREDKAKRGNKHQIMLTGDLAKALKRKDYDAVLLEDLTTPELEKISKVLILGLMV